MSVLLSWILSHSFAEKNFFFVNSTGEAQHRRALGVFGAAADAAVLASEDTVPGALASVPGRLSQLVGPSQSPK